MDRIHTMIRVWWSAPGAVRMHGARHRRGFTLLELMLVLTIIGIVAGMVAPQIDVAAHRTRAVAQEVGATLLLAQRLAVRSQHDVVVAFDTAHQRIRVHEDADNDGEVDAGERTRITELGEGVVFGRASAPARPVLGPGPVRFAGRQAGLPAVTFHRNGAASEEGGFYITSRRAVTTGVGEYTRAVEVQRSTGRATWYRYHASEWRREF